MNRERKSILRPLILKLSMKRDYDSDSIILAIEHKKIDFILNVE